MQSCFSSKGLALSTSIGKHCLPRIVTLEIMNNNCHVVSAIVSRRIVSNFVGGGGLLGDGLESLGSLLDLVECSRRGSSSYDINCWVVGSVELGSGGWVVVGCFVMELSSIDETLAQTAGQRPSSIGGCLGGGESVEVKLQ